jgi:hypothetical protein
MAITFCPTSRLAERQRKEERARRLNAQQGDIELIRAPHYARHELLTGREGGKNFLAAFDDMVGSQHTSGVIENKAGADGAGLTLAIRLRLPCRHRRNVDHAAACVAENRNRVEFVLARRGHR